MNKVTSSLFSMFDPSSAPFSSLGLGKWSFIVTPLLAMSWVVFSRPSGLTMSFSSMIKTMKSVSIQYTSASLASVMMILIVSLFITLFCWNEIGLVPFSFGLTSHLVINFSLAMALFLSGVIASLMLKGWKSIVGHMVPYGAPLGLSFVLVLVETTSYLIRPFTLSLRLTGNMVTGHLLVALLCEAGSSVVFFSVFSSMLVSMLSSCLLFFEVLVSLVQATIFTLLMLMYWSEN